MGPRSARKRTLRRTKWRIGFTVPCALAFLFLTTGWVGARNLVTLVIDGRLQRCETYAETVGEVLSSSKIDLRKQDSVTPDLASPVGYGATVVVRRAIPVTVRVDGGEKTVLTSAATVADAISAGDIRVEPGDKVETPVHLPVASGLVVSITKQVVKEESINEPLPFKVIKQRDANLELGKTIVQRLGRPGLVEKIFRVTYLGGQEIARELKMKVVRERPLAKIVRVGALRRFIPARGQETERPLPVSSEPLPNSQEGIASYYTLRGKGIGMTAAHRSLPYGTKVRVTNLANGRQIEVVINDRGPYRQGRIIDLATDAFRQIASTSQGVCRVRVEW